MFFQFLSTSFFSLCFPEHEFLFFFDRNYDFSISIESCVDKLVSPTIVCNFFSPFPLGLNDGECWNFLIESATWPTFSSQRGHPYWVISQSRTGMDPELLHLLVRIHKAVVHQFVMIQIIRHRDGCRYVWLSRDQIQRVLVPAWGRVAGGIGTRRPRPVWTQRAWI